MIDGPWRCAVLSVCLWAFLAVPAAGETREVAFEEFQGVVRNPDCGWVAYNYEDSYAARTRLADGKEPFAAASVVYTRHPTVKWVGEDGRYETSAPLRLLEDWMNHGRRVAFRIYANNLNDLPAAMRSAVPLVDRGGAAPGIVYWDRNYVEDHGRLVRFLGERLGGSPRLAYVDIGGVGDTGGEWYFDGAEPYEAAGLTDDRFFALVVTFVEMYRDAFPDTPLFISYEAIAKAGKQRGSVMALLLKHRIGLRDDGLGGWPYPKDIVDPTAWPMVLFANRTPALFEGGGRGGGVYGWKLQGKSPEAVLEWVFEKCPPTYVNLGGAETASQKACDEQAELLEAFGAKLGYRFALTKAVYEDRAVRGEARTLRMRWANRGAALCYNDREMVLALFRPDGTTAWRTFVSPNPPTSAWRGGREVDVTAAWQFPNDLDPGVYTFKVGLRLGDGRVPEAMTRLANVGAAGDSDMVTIGPLTVAMP